MLNVYQGNGYANRESYLEDLADQAGEDGWKVHVLADMLGPTEDFDGLISMLQDEGVDVCV